ncbi:META domain-containing protein [Ornithinimicrobium sediminis]|uniref:META domain-containing protein n=1 Tax=Ornithinimicrobium sediminis TaxID=2904603 RepID=UPI001E60E898|nr:META domain-containing protein [Ornithinimicrobium sediminis]MCE0487121.1 META domain-containing protein [Ornithinimicrobium sediminis]
MVLTTTPARGRTRLLVLLVVGTVGLLAACGSTSSDGPAESSAPDAATLEGTSWRVVSVVDEAGRTTEVPDEVTATATFEDGTVSGTGGCNRWSAPYEIAGTSLTVGEAASTMMACPGAPGEVEAAFLGALPRVSGWAAGDDGLTLLDASGGTVLALTEQASTALTGTTWVATMVDNGRGAAAGVVAGSEVTAEFDDEGRVAGSSGCNQYTARYTLEGESLEVGALAGTRRACADAEVTDQESAFLRAMERSTVARVEADRLELRDDEGALQVSFVARP